MKKDENTMNKNIIMIDREPGRTGSLESLANHGGTTISWDHGLLWSQGKHNLLKIHDKTIDPLMHNQGFPLERNDLFRNLFGLAITFLSLFLTVRACARRTSGILLLLQNVYRKVYVIAKKKIYENISKRYNSIRR
jgi:hypothetical protein